MYARNVSLVSADLQHSDHSCGYYQPNVIAEIEFPSNYTQLMESAVERRC